MKKILLVVVLVLLVSFVFAVDGNNSCTTEYDPVCGNLEEVYCWTVDTNIDGNIYTSESCKGPGLFTYSNSCFMEAEGATLVDDDECYVCTGEGETMPVYPGYECCENLVAINPQTTAEPLVGASICSNCGNGICEQWENEYNCSDDCEDTVTACTEDARVCDDGSTVVRDPNNNCEFYDCPDNACTTEYNPVCASLPVQCITTPCLPVLETYSNKCLAEQASATVVYLGECKSNETVKEQVKCVFTNTTQRQKCYAYYGSSETTVSYDTVSTTNEITTSSVNANLFSCTTGENNNYETCVADVIAPKGTKLIWKSTCRGYASTIVDGDNEYAKFECLEDDIEPICTEEYAPVCGTIEVCTTTCETNNITSDETTTCEDTCYKERKTFENACKAKSAGVQEITKGKCGIQTCPLYEQPPCRDGKIEVTYDNRGCKKPRCVAEEAEHFIGAYWQCSNGEEFKETDRCMPYSYWKNKARNTCAQYSTKCATSGSMTSTQSNSGSGNFMLEVGVNQAGVSTVQSRAVREVQATEKCIGGEVYVTDFETFGSCAPGREEKCKYYVNENGCRIKECVNGDSEKVCPSEPEIITNTYRKAYWQCYSGKESYEGGESSCKTVDTWKQYAEESCRNECNSTETVVCDVDSNTCETSTVKCGVNSFQVSAPCYDGKPVICSTQNEKEIRAAKEKCFNQGGEIKVKLNSRGCREYICGTETNECRTLDDVSEEKKFKCEERGGELLTRVDESGCLTYLDCVGEKINDENASIDKEIVKDSLKLLDLAIKIETAKIELENTANKIREIAIYYEEQGKMEDANRFYKAANILEAAAQKLEEIKLEIKNNIDNFGEERALRIRELIRNIKEELLKEALLEMLG